jgi:hypothetical protein
MERRFLTLRRGGAAVVRLGFYGLRHDDSWLAGLAWALLAGLGSGVATLIGTICGAIALRGGRSSGLAVLALVLNLGVLVLSAVLLLWAFDWF